MKRNKSALNERRKSAYERNVTQLSNGFKNTYIGEEYISAPLTEKDIKRIKKENDILKSRIKIINYEQ